MGQVRHSRVLSMQDKSYENAIQKTHQIPIEYAWKAHRSLHGSHRTHMETCMNRAQCDDFKAVRLSAVQGRLAQYPVPTNSSWPAYGLANAADGQSTRLVSRTDRQCSLMWS